MTFFSNLLFCTDLVAEIKELKEKQRKEDDLLFAIAAGNRQPVAPQLDYTFMDEGIHEDVFNLFRYSCEEVCSTKEQLNKVMRLWTSFLEPMIGLPSRSHSKGTFELNDKTTTNHSSLRRGGSDRSPNVISSIVSFKQPRFDKDRGKNKASGLINGDASLKEHNDSSSTTHKEFMGIIGRNEDSAGPNKSEKEEGELSPNGEFDENHIVDHGNHSVSEEGRGNCAEADGVDSDNVSGRECDVSGSESAGNVGIVVIRDKYQVAT